MNKTEIRNVFRNEKVQLSEDAIRLIQEDLRRTVTKMAKRCKEGNVKRLNSDLYFIAIGKI